MTTLAQPINTALEHSPVSLFLHDLTEALQRLPPVTVLPEQFHHLTGKTRAVRGEVALMRAVLLDALECFQKQVGGPSPHAQRLAREAERWLFADDERWPFSFVNICAVVGLNPAYVRRGLQGWLQASLAHPPGEPLQRLLVSRRSPPHGRGWG